MNDLSNLKMEGQLYKYTNVMRGYQFRYFRVDAQHGRLDYFMSEDMKHQRPRCSIHLHGAVISPSDEDSTTFMVYSTDNEMYRLRAQDAKERQRWVDILRLVSQSCHEPSIEREIQQKSQQPNFNQNGHSKSTNDLKTVPTMVKNETLINRQLINEILHQVNASQKLLEKNIANLSISNTDGLTRLDREVLILKATSKACVSSLSECCNVLNVNKMKKRNWDMKDAAQNSIQKPQINRSNNASPSDLDSSMKSAKSVELNLNTTNSCSTNTFLSHTALNINHNDELTDDEQSSTDVESDGQLFDDDHKSLILHVLSNLKLGMDLTKITLPTFILDNRSLLELFADCMAHPDIFIKINDEKTPEDRIIAVLNWYLTSFHRIRKGALNKKPYNPMVGETFHCSWKVANESLNESSSSSSDASSSESNSKLLTYCAEQVSHHPAITAFYFECEESKIKLNASINTKSQFLGMSIGVSLVGSLVLKLGQHNEEYTMTLPSCYARSILTHPWIELGDKVSIACPQSGYTVSVVFHVKPFYGENSNQISAEVRNKNEEIVCRVQGAWNGTLEYKFTNELKVNKIVDINSLKCIPKRVRPIKLQSSLESRRLWQHVTQALAKSDIESATNYKTTLEMQQRTNLKLEIENGDEHKAKYFIKNMKNNGKEEEWQHQNWLI